MSEPLSQREWVLTALEQFEGRLVRYASRLLGDEHAARDVVQHAFLRLCRASPDEVGDRLAAWLFTVCRNRVLDCLKQAGRESSLTSWDDNEGQGCPDIPRVRGTDPAAIAEQNELHARIREAVAELPGGQREAVLLYAEGFPYREIAAITARTEGNVRVIVHRAMVRLRTHPQLQYLIEERGPRLGDESSAVPPVRISTTKV